MTHLPREVRSLFGGDEGGAAAAQFDAIWDDYDGLVRRAALRGSPASGAHGALGALRGDWIAASWRYAARWARVAGRSRPSSTGARARWTTSSGGLEGMLDDQDRRALYKREPRLRELKNYLFPRGLAQERKLSLSSIVSLWGNDTADLLIELSDRHLDALAGGCWMHYGVSDGRSSKKRDRRSSAGGASSRRPVSVDVVGARRASRRRRDRLRRIAGPARAAGPPGRSGGSHPRRLATAGDVATRRREAEEAASVLGLHTRRNLALPDGRLSHLDGAQLASVVQALRELRPFLVLAPFPRAVIPITSRRGFWWNAPRISPES